MKEKIKLKKLTTPRLEDIIPDEQKREEVISRLYSGDPILGNGGIFTEMLQSMVNAALEGELDEKLNQRSTGDTNRRNGHTSKVVRSAAGPLSIQTPRDRKGTHEPVLIRKWERELGTGVDEIILSLYARGHSVEDVRHQLQHLYGLEVSAGVISAVTERVWAEIIEWQQRPLYSCYPIVNLDAIHYKISEAGHVISSAPRFLRSSSMFTQMRLFKGALYI